MVHPMLGLLGVTVHHGRRGRNAELMRCANYFNPLAHLQLVWTQGPAHSIVQNFGCCSRNTAQTRIFEHQEVVAESHACLLLAVDNFHWRTRMQMQLWQSRFYGPQQSGVIESIEVSGKPTLYTDFSSASIHRFD